MNVNRELDWPYTTQDLSAAIVVMPHMYGRLNELGLFPGESVSTTLVEVAIEDRVLNLLPTHERGEDPTLGASAEGQSIFLKLPHIPLKNTLKPEGPQDKVTWVNGQRQRVGIEQATAKKLRTHRNKHAVTLGHLRMGALKDVIIDGGGVTLYDLFTVFGATKKIVTFDLSDPATVMREKCYELKRHMEENLLGANMNGARFGVEGILRGPRLSSGSREVLSEPFAGRRATW